MSDEKLCRGCPNRHLATLFDTLGEPEKAAFIRSTGCPARWVTRYEDKQTGQLKDLEACAWEHLPKLLNSLGADSREVTQSAQTLRNENAAALTAMKSAIIHEIKSSFDDTWGSVQRQSVLSRIFRLFKPYTASVHPRGRIAPAIDAGVIKRLNAAAKEPDAELHNGKSSQI